MPPAPLTTNQIRGFWAAWTGWALDGMDSFIYALVLVPALKDLLPHSGVAVTSGAIGYYGGLLFALFLAGWGLAFLWGPVADRFGRVRTLMLTVVCYSVFTLLGAVATNVWMLAAFRLLAGVGIGGEWTMGGVFIAEEWPESRRVRGAGYMHTGYYFGIFLAAALNYTVGAHYGWRAMFLIGGTPALLVSLFRRGVHEPERWQKTATTKREHWFRSPLAAIFAPQYRRRTIVNTLLLFVSIIGLWGGSVYVPTAVTQLATAAGHSAASAAQLASWGTIVLSAGTIAGCFAAAPLAERFGRKIALAFYFATMAFALAMSFGYVFYIPHALAWFFVCLFLVGVGGANFAIYTIWLPEQYNSACRASAFAFATSTGRLAAAGITFLVGAGVDYFHTIGIPVALTSIAFVLGLTLIPLGAETQGEALPT